jgi:ferredoxin-NADP reductase
MAATAFTTALTEKIARTPGTMSFRFARPRGFEYQAGRWFVLSLPPGSSPTDPLDGPLEKHFTFSSSPTESFLEFTTRLTGSPFKEALRTLEPGAEVHVEAPFGGFVLRPEMEKVAFLAAGIGVTTVRSILRFAADTHDRRPIVLLYGNTSEATITFREDLDRTVASLPRLRLVHVLSAPGPDWTGYSGHLSEDVIRAEIGQVSAWTFMVSGPPAMVESVRSVLDGLGVERSHMVFERFEGYRAFIS